MNEDEDFANQQQEQQDALNAALEIAAAAAAAAQQDEELADVEGEEINGTQEGDIHDGDHPLEQEADPAYVIDNLQPKFEMQGEHVIHPDFETGHPESIDQSQSADIYQQEGDIEASEGPLDTITPANGEDQAQEAGQIENGMTGPDSEAGNIGQYEDPSDTLADMSGLQQAEQESNEIESANQFDQNEGNEVASSSRSVMQQSQNNRSLTHHSKRRKINTCLPCKRRKVKCDREKPYCGQCKKSQIPEEECTWSAPVDHNSITSGTSSLTPFPSTADTSLNNGNNSQWLLPTSDTPVWNGSLSVSGQAAESVQALLERIVTLESALAASRSQKPINGSSGEWSDEKVSLGSGDARGIAADALAMIARQSGEDSLGVANRHSKITYKRLFAQASLTWPSMSALSSRVRDDLTLLPDVKGLFGALQALDAVQQHGILLGVPIALVEAQLAFLITQSSLPADQFPAIDLSAVALFYYLLAVSVDLMSTEQAILLELVENEEAIPGVIDIWIETADHIMQEMQYDSRPNLNIVITLLLKRQFQASRGNENAASVALGSCILLSRGMAIDKIGSQKDDLSTWESSSDNKRQPDSWQMVIDQAQFMNPLFSEDSNLDSQSISKLPWLSPRNALVREAARQVYTYLALQDWTADALSTMSISPSENISLPLPLAPNTVTEEYILNAESDESTPSVLHLLRYCFKLSHKLACWKRDGRVSGMSANNTETERALLDEFRPTFLRNDYVAAEEDDLTRILHLRLVADLVLQYCLFTVRKSDSSLAEQSIDAAEKILQTRSMLGLDFLAPLHKFFWIQRYTLEAAVMIVIYLHQYSAHLSEERRQALQALIDDAYAQPGFENAHSLLSLSFDVVQVSPEQKGEDETSLSPGIPMDNLPTVLGGMILSNGKRLASSHPIVVGLRMFVDGQSLPYGSTQETLDFWDAMQRYCQLFLIG
ncbi:uncharacterized protein FA14DRAFT_159663 [Meira miltonrushii]|uniref:Zn(2)-C6 fungal-type domain-containing protein n=1 Tax=Meira miltonrushii TaxID=1280837 RepID=A0A316VJU3_9BASI|nr:uncharacterized protein FA14DRAFT_159663 [Meira miltonrushii]PWN37780.1 hypothetical protein FA14DRAFT_159663 [Meira miltonrushii]